MEQGRADAVGERMGATPGAEGFLLGRYELGPLVGLGGTARVFRAWDHEGGGSVAVKIFPSGSATSSRSGSREHEVLTGIRHPGLVEVRDSGVDDDGRPFVVMDFVEGESLAARLRRGPLPAGAVLEMGAVLADALAHVHARGIVHRDIKPGNVLLDGAGRPWLADFGIARIVDATRVTATGVVVGTAAYMAPEQVRGEAVGPAADVYALGLVLLEAVTGRREYEGGAVESALARLNRGPRVPSEVADPLAAAVRRMTRTEPAERPTAAHAAVALGEQDPGLAADPARRGLARRLVPIAAVAVLATTAFGGALLVGGGGQTGAGASPTDTGSGPTTAAVAPPVAVPPVAVPSAGAAPVAAAVAPVVAAPVPAAQAEPAPRAAPAAPQVPAPGSSARAAVDEVAAQAAERGRGNQEDQGQDGNQGKGDQGKGGGNGKGADNGADNGNKGNKGKGGNKGED